MKQPLHFNRSSCSSPLPWGNRHSVASLQNILNLPKRQELMFTGHLIQALLQTLIHDNPSLETIQGWVLSFQWRETQSLLSMLQKQDPISLPPRSLLFPPAHTCNSQKEWTILLRTLESQCGLCLSSHPIPRMLLFLGNIFNQNVVYHTLLKKWSN